MSYSSGTCCIYAVADLCFLVYAGKLRVDKDSAAIFADNHLLVKLHLYLALCRDAVEASAAGIALHVDDSKTVAGILADALESLEQTWLDFLLEGFRLLAELLLVLLCLGDDFAQF